MESVRRIKEFNNHVHLYNYTKKILLNKGYEIEDNTKEALMKACLEIYEFTLELGTLPVKRNIYTPCESFIHFMDITNTVDDIKDTIKSYEKMIGDYNKMVQMKSEDIAKDVYYLERYCCTKRLPVYISQNWKIESTLEPVLQKIANVSGVYRLYDEDKVLIYIGKSYTLGSRIPSSAAERNATYFDYTAIPNKADTDIYETYYINLYRPKCNVDCKSGCIPSITLPSLEFSSMRKLRVVE